MSLRETARKFPKSRATRTKTRITDLADGENNRAIELRSLTVLGPPSGDNSVRLDADAPNFEFVTTIGEPSNVNSTEVSRTVRAQAMKDYLRRQNRQAITGVVEVVTSVNPEQPARYKGRFKLNTWSHKTRTKAINAQKDKYHTERSTRRGKSNKKQAQAARESDNQLEVSRPKRGRQPNLVFILDGRHLDPFDTLSIRLGPRSDRLLHHYHNCYSMNSVAINPEGDFFSHARADPALLHSILYLVALHHDLKLGDSESPESFYHGGEAFRLINERLEDGVFSNMTIAAVAMLVTKENLNGNYELSKIHMQGLAYMIQKQGGVSKINGVFGRIVTWSDFCYANVWNCQPRFPRLHTKTKKTLIFQNPDPNRLHPEDLFGPSSSIISIIQLLRTLSSDLDPESRIQPNRLVACSMIYNLEYSLLSLNRPPSSDSCPFSFEVIPLKIAIHLFLYLVIRELPPTSQLLTRLVGRLQDALEIQLGGWWDINFERKTWLLWILFMGGAASAGRFERWWFVRELADLCKVLGIWSIEELKESLEKVLWREDWCLDHCMSLWNDVLGLEESDGGLPSPDVFQSEPYLHRQDIVLSEIDY